MTTQRKSTFAIRHGAILAWVRRSFDTKPRSSLTSESIAIQATQDLGFHVDPTRMAKALDREGVLFRRTKADPPQKKYSRVDLLAARMTLLESKVATMVRKLAKV